MNDAILRELTAGGERRDMKVEAARLVQKWSRTGLLEGLEDSQRNPMKSTMARLLENQAQAMMLTEASQTADIIGFQNVAFPIVRRVFAGLIANELVSVQPMSLPSGLLFYMDYRFDTVKAGNRNDDFTAGGSLFGTQTGVGTENLAQKGFYNLGSSFSQREKVTSTGVGGTGTGFSGSLQPARLSDISWDPELSSSLTSLNRLILTGAYTTIAALNGAQSSLNDIKQWVPVSGSSTSAGGSTDGTPVQIGGGLIVYRRHTTKTAGGDLVFVVDNTTGASARDLEGLLKVSYTVGSTLSGGTSGSLVLDAFESDMGSTPLPTIPEIDFRIQSVAVTANSRKLRAKWTPELAQDLAAYQNLDAEVELTSVLSETIALEIDREILGELLVNASGANFYWSRKPGNFLVKDTGNTATGASFTGTVREWYETLIETIIDVANNIHRKTLRGAANWIVTSPDVATILEASVLYKPVLSMDPKETMFSVGTEKVGSIMNRFTVYKDPYFPRNKILIGYKGSSFLETGFVYAPYVPLIVTPTIYGVDDFTPRKGVMTRYAKKLVRSDFYGTVTVQDMNVI